MWSLIIQISMFCACNITFLNKINLRVSEVYCFVLHNAPTGNYRLPRDSHMQLCSQKPKTCKPHVLVATSCEYSSLCINIQFWNKVNTTMASRVRGIEDTWFRSWRHGRQLQDNNNYVTLWSCLYCKYTGDNYKRL
jgi:hypothetical protein